MAAQYAFVMKDMTKSFPGAQKPVLSNINPVSYTHLTLPTTSRV